MQSIIEISGLKILNIQQVSLTNQSVPAGSTGVATGTGVAVPGANNYYGLYMNSGFYPCIPQGAITATVNGNNLDCSCTLRNLHNTATTISIRAMIIATE